jgi:hypothetical protein
MKSMALNQIMAIVNVNRKIKDDGLYSGTVNAIQTS